MHIKLDAEMIVTGLSVIITIITLIKYYNKAHGWFMKKDNKENDQDNDIQSIKDEQEVLTKGILACLKGLHEQGCNGPVTKSIQEIEEHLNAKAHD